MIISPTQISQTASRSSLTNPALRPIGLELGGLVGVVESLLVFGLGSIDGGSVGVKDVVAGFKFDGLGEFVTVWISSR